MSTSYYAYIKLKPSVKDDIKKAIDEDDMIEFRQLSEHINNTTSEIPIGHRAGGWKFSWNPYNRHLKSFDKKGIEEFIYREDVVIYNEYDELIDKDKFLKMAYEWGAEDGWDSLTYMRDHPDEHTVYSYTEYQRKLCRTINKEIKFDSPYQADFYSDGLRWSIFE